MNNGEIFPNLMKMISPQTETCQCALSTRNIKENTPKIIISKFFKTSDKEKTFKTTGVEKPIFYRDELN